MSIRKTLLMLTLNYIVIFAWMFWFRMEEMSALIIFPITMGIAFLDTVLSEGRKSAYFWCGNLLIATVTGILLQAYLFIRETGDIDSAVLRVAVEIPVAILIIALVAVISGHEAAKLKKNRQKKAAMGGVITAEIERDRGNLSEGRNNPVMSMDLYREEPEDDMDDEDFDDEDQDEDIEPKFRVIKKS